MVFFLCQYTKCTYILITSVNIFDYDRSDNDYCINSLVPEMKTAKFAKREAHDEVAHHEPPHLDLHCLPSSLWTLNMIAWT